MSDVHEPKRPHPGTLWVLKLAASCLKAMPEDGNSEWQQGWDRLSDAFRRATAPVNPDADVRPSRWRTCRQSNLWHTCMASDWRCQAITLDATPRRRTRIILACVAGRGDARRGEGVGAKHRDGGALRPDPGRRTPVARGPQTRCAGPHHPASDYLWPCEQQKSRASSLPCVASSSMRTRNSRSRLLSTTILCMTAVLARLRTSASRET